MKNIPFEDGLEWLGDDIGCGWQIPSVHYEITQGFYEGRSKYTNIIFSPDLEDDILWVYMRSNKIRLKKID